MSIFSATPIFFSNLQEPVGLGAPKALSQSGEAKIGPSEDSSCRICRPIAQLWDKKTVFTECDEVKNGPLRSVCSRRIPSPTGC